MPSRQDSQPSQSITPSVSLTVPTPDSPTSVSLSTQVCAQQLSDGVLQLSNTSESVPPLPEFAPMANQTFIWGVYDSATISSTLSSAYNEVVHWRRNNFPVPTGKVGKSFVSELSRLFRAYAEGSALESIALKATTVASILLLQKPHHKSKTKDHISCLERRLKLWKDGEFANLVNEGKTLQKRLPKHHLPSKQAEDNLARSFSNLMFEGKTKAALQLLYNRGKGGVLHLDDTVPSNNGGSTTVLEALKSKHPTSQPASTNAIHPAEDESTDIHPVVFDCIDAAQIRSAALRTNGAAGPSGIDAKGWRRLCTAFKSDSNDLCHSLALLARRLSTTYLDPTGLSPFLACRLIALDKNPGVRPIGVCETARRIIAKAILSVTRGDIQDAAGSLQLCAGQIAGAEAAVHATRESFLDDNTEAILLVDASNAFNVLNRQVALHNISMLCPSIATTLINTYRAPTDLFVDGSSLLSQEGTTQGDPLAMPMYAVATIPLIRSLPDTVQQVWYADDASASGASCNLRAWWDKVLALGPAYGYHANALKTWLIVKPEHLASAEAAFSGTQVNITTEGRPYLGVPLGTQEYCDKFISMKVKEWCTGLEMLSSIAETQPHAAYAAATHGMASKWSYLSRTVPNIRDFLHPLESAIRMQFIPALTGRPPPNDAERNLMTLPVRLGGLGIYDPSRRSPDEFTASLQVTDPLKHLINEKNQSYTYEAYTEQVKAKTDIHNQRRSQQLASATLLKPMLPKPLQRSMALAQEKGASSWLTALPVSEFGFTLHKSAFRDALCLRYGWLPTRTPIYCDCGTHFSIEHALSCPKGGFPSIRHNEIRDITANLLSEICNNVCIEPHLQPITGEHLTGASANTQDGARLDIVANGLWGGRSERTYLM